MYCTLNTLRSSGRARIVNVVYLVGISGHAGDTFRTPTARLSESLSCTSADSFVLVTPGVFPASSPVSRVADQNLVYFSTCDCSYIDTIYQDHSSSSSSLQQQVKIYYKNHGFSTEADFDKVGASTLR